MFKTKYRFNAEIIKFRIKSGWESLGLAAEYTGIFFCRLSGCSFV